MAKHKLSSQDIKFRPAQPSDAAIAARLLFDTFPKLAVFVIGLGSQERAMAILERLFVLEGHRFSYEYAQTAFHQGRVVGLFIAYPCRALGKLNRRLGRLLFRQYRLRGKLALIARALPLVFIQEAGRDEFLLSNLAVKKRVRNQGIGAKILAQVEEQARARGLRKVSLLVAIENRDARRFYERYGYKIRAIQLESNKRVPYLGAGYQRMVKVVKA